MLVVIPVELLFVLVKPLVLPETLVAPLEPFVAVNLPSVGCPFEMVVEPEHSGHSVGTQVECDSGWQRIYHYLFAGFDNEL